MDEIIRTMRPDQFIGFTAVVIGAGGGILLGIVSVIGGLWHSHRRAEAETQLKRDLLAAGFGPDEIERVVQATSGGKPAARERVAVRG
ncbi:MAG: hypothetical protein U0871_00415 [Gemmataceae bacterium]